MAAKNTRSNANAAASPDEIASLLCNRFRDLRKSRGWTLEQLASMSGVSRSMLSEIERNQANPTLGVAYRIAQAFGTTLGSLVDPPSKSSTIDIIRGGDRVFHFRHDDDCQIRTLSPLQLEKDAEFYELVIRPGAALRSAPHFAGTRELLTIQQGNVKVTAGEDVCELGPRDSGHYPADVPHAIENTGKVKVIAFMVVLYRQN
jgi:transcriptional regulator with XRE-family HTH domain